MIVLTDPRQKILEQAVENYVGYRQKKAQDNALNKGLDLLNTKPQPTYTNDDLNNVVQYNYGLQGAVGLNARDTINNNKISWDSTQKQIADIDTQLANTGLDQTTRDSLSAQRTNLLGMQSRYATQNDLLRGVLGKKGANLSGLGKDDNYVPTSAPANYAFDTPNLSAPTAKPTNLFGNGIPSTQGSTSPAVNTDWLSLKQNNPDYFSQFDNTSLPTASNNDYVVTAEDLARNEAIKNTALKMAMQRDKNNFNQADYIDSEVKRLRDGGVDNSTITKLMPQIERKAANVANQYLADAIESGNYKNAAIMGLRYGLGQPAVALADTFGGKTTVGQENLGDVINTYAITNPGFGQLPTKQSIGQSTLALSPEAKLRGNQFDKTYELQLANHDLDVIKTQNALKTAEKQLLYAQNQADRQEKQYMLNTIKSAIDSINDDTKNNLLQLKDLALDNSPDGVAQAAALREKINKNSAVRDIYLNQLNGMLGIPATKQAQQSSNMSPVMNQFLKNMQDDLSTKGPEYVRQTLLNNRKAFEDRGIDVNTALTWIP